jgi:phosphoglycerate kinase
LPPSARNILAGAEGLHREIVLPVDVVVARELKANARSRMVTVEQVEAADMILDIGRRSIEHVCAVLARARTLVWNGPFGAFETAPCSASGRTRRAAGCRRPVREAAAT